MSHPIITVASVLIAVVSLSLLAAEKHSGHIQHSGHGSVSGQNASAEQGGQAAFAALIDIVAMLEQDVNTDWNAVNIDGLRAHLLDMDHLILDTNATTEVIDDQQIQYTVSGNEASTPSIHRMVPAHSGFIAQSRGWTIEHELNNTGATVTITGLDSHLVKRLKALGFYGFMSLDSHHQAHHVQMANGHSH